MAKTFFCSGTATNYGRKDMFAICAALPVRIERPRTNAQNKSTSSGTVPPAAGWDARALDSIPCAGIDGSRQRGNAGISSQPRSPGASSLVANIACSPRQIPSSGVPCETASRKGFPRTIRSARASERRNGRHQEGSAPKHSPNASGVVRAAFGPRGDARRAPRKEDFLRRNRRVRFSQQSFGAGQHPRSRLSRATAKRNARANALKIAST